MLAIVGVALGVNVMIVVIAFMQGFQEKFKTDIIDAQGHARIIAINPEGRKIELDKVLQNKKEILGFSSYLQGQLLVQRQEYRSIPHAIGLNPENCTEVLPLNEFLANGFNEIKSFDSTDRTPCPTVDDLEDGVVFISLEVANRLGVRPAAILQIISDRDAPPGNDRTGIVKVKKLDPFVSRAEWEFEFLGSSKVLVKETLSNFETEKFLTDGGVIDFGFGYPSFEIIPGNKPFEKGQKFRFQTFPASTIEIYAPSMIEKAKMDEMSPPMEVKVGGILEVPWQGFHAEILIGTIRFMQDLQAQPRTIDGYYLKFAEEVASSESKLKKICVDLEKPFAENWAVIPWFVENAWFFDLLKFEEYLMVLIMIPIGLVAAFAIAIALMTSVLRKIREIGLLVAMGGSPFSVGTVFCLQGFIIGALGAILGCVLALFFIRYRDELMSFIVEKIAGAEGQVGVTQFYDFYSLDVFYPWESSASLLNFMSFASFAIIISTIAGLVPAWRAAKLNPADALRSD